MWKSDRNINREWRNRIYMESGHRIKLYELSESDCKSGIDDNLYLNREFGRNLPEYGSSDGKRRS